ncbi:MAG TPA: alpha/beta fold hydrolase [Polyangia bacterium]|jgi:pimeloyl-ACP methyl ester carboxylesterase|nr:alpha/beta fold hydrolase [Polyangia bacterium]
MPHLPIHGAEIYYEDTGGSGEPIVFSHGLLWSCRMYDAQVGALRDRYRCVAYDHRGQGQSVVSPPGSAPPTIDMEMVTADAIALIEGLGLGRVHFCGLSMGGFVGMRIAARRPDLLRSLVLLETSADPEPAENVPRYRLLNFIARWIGLGPVATPVMRIMFSRSFLRDPGRGRERELWRARLVGNRRDIWRAVNGVIERRGVYEELGRISAPTLVVVGEEDVATVPAKAERIHQAIAGSRLVRIPRAGHSSTIEEPEAVTAAIGGFLEGVSAAAGGEDG